MSSDVDDFLEHFGVKGMKWGHRRNDVSPTKAKLSTKKKVAIGGAAVGGAAIAAVVLKKFGSKKISDLPYEVSGKDFRIRSNDPAMFDIAFRALLGI